MRNLLIKKPRLNKKYKHALNQMRGFKLIETSKRKECGGVLSREGDGQAWYSYSFINASCWVRDIKAGQWAGYWRLENP